MKNQLMRRLAALREEFESGQQMLAELRDKEQNLEQTLLRISGAIQVLEEMLGHNCTPPSQDDGQMAPDDAAADLPVADSAGP